MKKILCNLAAVLMFVLLVQIPILAATKEESINYAVKANGGTSSSNATGNNYANAATSVDSYLSELSNGNYERVE